MVSQCRTKNADKLPTESVTSFVHFYTERRVLDDMYSLAQRQHLALFVHRLLGRFAGLFSRRILVPWELRQILGVGRRPWASRGQE